MRYLTYIVSSSCGAAGLIMAFCFVLRSGKIVTGALIGWGLSIVCIFLVSVVFPAIVAVYDTEYVAFFPEAIGVLCVIFFGWAPALVVAVFARLVKLGIEYCAKTDRPAAVRQKHEDGKS